MWRATTWILAAALSAAAEAGVTAQPGPPGAVSGAGPVLDGITFAAEPGVLYLPLREIAETLEWPVRWDSGSRTASLNGRAVSPGHTRWLSSGSQLLAVRELKEYGAEVAWNPERRMAQVSGNERAFWVRLGRKRVVIHRGLQRLRAWQGDRLVLDTRVSTGRRGHRTPAGTFRAGPYKARMHYSRLYDNAPMPWSIQVHGHVFIHGYHHVPRRRASHGCIRVPLTGRNPARLLWEWTDRGTPIHIGNRWPRV